MGKFKVSESDEVFFAGVLLSIGQESITGGPISKWTDWWDRRNKLLLTRSPYGRSNDSDGAMQWLRNERVKYNIWLEESDGRRHE